MGLSVYSAGRTVSINAMNLQEWKKLSRPEKERIWATLSESETSAIRNRRRHSRSKSHDYHSTSGYGPGRATGLPVQGSMILRATGMLIILGVVTISLVSPELIGENGGVTSFLAAILCGIVCATAASILDRQEALMEQLQNTDARVARIEERIAPRRDPARQEEAPTTGAAD